MGATGLVGDEQLSPSLRSSFQHFGGSLTRPPPSASGVETPPLIWLTLSSPGSARGWDLGSKSAQEVGQEDKVMTRTAKGGFAAPERPYPGTSSRLQWPRMPLEPPGSLPRTLVS